MLNLFVSLKLFLMGVGYLGLPLETVAGESQNASVTRSFLLSLMWQNLLFVGGFLAVAALVAAWILRQHRSTRLAARELPASSVIERLKELEKP